jgi:hypothetical protein
MNALDTGLSTATGQVLKESVGIKPTLQKVKEAAMIDASFRNFWGTQE